MRLKLPHAMIADVDFDTEKDKRLVVLNVNEEFFFQMLDSVNPSNIVKYLYMRGIKPSELKYNIQHYGKGKEQ